MHISDKESWVRAAAPDRQSVRDASAHAYSTKKASGTNLRSNTDSAVALIAVDWIWRSRVLCKAEADNKQRRLCETRTQPCKQTTTYASTLQCLALHLAPRRQTQDCPLECSTIMTHAQIISYSMPLSIANKAMLENIWKKYWIVASHYRNELQRLQLDRQVALVEASKQEIRDFLRIAHALFRGT